MKDFRKVYIFSAGVIFIAFALVLTGCGGGGGGGGQAQPETPITAEKAPAVAGAVFQASNFSGLSTDFTGFGGTGISSASLRTQSKPPIKSILDKVVSIAKSQKNKSQICVAGSMPPTTESCSGGGTVTVSGTWIGPDEPTDPSQVVDFTANSTFNSCKEAETTMNGTMSIAFKGSLSAPTRLTVSTSSFTFVNTEDNDNISMTNLSVDFTDLVFTGDELIGCTITLSGAVSGNVGADPINQEYDNFKMVLNEGATGTTASISGRLKASCLGGWVTVATNTPVFIPGDADCPTTGEIVVTSGGNSVKMVIASDFKITIYYNDAIVQTYNNCEDVDGLCVG